VHQRLRRQTRRWPASARSFLRLEASPVAAGLLRRRRHPAWQRPPALGHASLSCPPRDASAAECPRHSERSPSPHARPAFEGAARTASTMPRPISWAGPGYPAPLTEQACASFLRGLDSPLRDKRAGVSRIRIGSRDSSLPASEYRQCKTARIAHSHTAHPQATAGLYHQGRDEALM
jgi:hypothetical protein